MLSRMKELSRHTIITYCSRIDARRLYFITIIRIDIFVYAFLRRLIIGYTYTCAIFKYYYGL